MSYERFTSTCDVCDGRKDVDTPFGIRVCAECDGEGVLKHGSFEVFFDRGENGTGWVLVGVLAGLPAGR